MKPLDSNPIVAINIATLFAEKAEVVVDLIN